MLEAIPEDARLLTYAELGELLGIEPESAKRRAVRHGWRRVPGNEGRTLVVVPRTAVPEVPPVPRTPARPEVPVNPNVPETPTRPEMPEGLPIPGDTPSRPGDTERAAVAARQDAEALRVTLRAAEQGRAEAEGRAAVLAEQVEAARRDADARTRELVEARERAARAEGESGALREQITAERERAEAVRAELAEWTAGGPLARALRAFLNRRGRV